MGVSFGTLEVEPLSFGSTDLNSIHLGDTLIWDKVAPEVNYIFRDIDGNGNLTLATGALEDVSGVKRVGDYGMTYAFYNCTGITGSVDLSSLISVGTYGLSYAFNGCTGITGSVDLSNLISVGYCGLNYAFYNCTGITSVDLSSLMSIDSLGLQGFFRGCTGLTNISFPLLTTVGSRAFSYTFSNCGNLEDVYFNSLTTTSFVNVDAFSYMMSGIGSTKTHTLHFPSNLETTISGLTGYPLFSGTSGYVVLAYDLPATS